MSAWPILLRILLSVALIFNGAATVAASAHMNHAGMAEAVQSAKVVQAVEAQPCHQHDQAASADPSGQPAVALDTGSSGSGHPTPDCCESGACRCACAHHAQAAIPDVVFNTPMIEHADSVRPMSWGHAPPALPHLIRPPIG